MSCGKCGVMKLCPVSLGLSLGLVMGLMVFIWSVWVVTYGVPPTMVGHVAPASLSAAAVMAFWAFIKGFIFGFFVALFYDLFKCCFGKWCCKKSGETCQCGTDHRAPPEIK